MTATDDGTGDWPPPRENPHLVGHDAAESTLLDAYAGGRLPHAWLIAGPRGIGKATLAYRFARFVLAGGGGAAAAADQGPGLFGDVLPAAPTGLDMDPEHPVFRRVAAGGHADLLRIERSLNDRGRLRSEIVVVDVRGAGRFMALTAAEGGWRVVVVDSADEMNRNAANALLKVLEEPPPRALMLLVSHSPGRLLATIRSRCRRLDLRPLAPDVLAGLIDRYRPGTPPADAGRLAVLAEGSVGRALDLASAGGLALFDDIAGLMAGLPDLDVPALHDFAGRVGRAGADDAYRTATDLFRWWLGHLVRGRATGAVAAAETGADTAAVLQRVAAAADLGRLLDFRDRAETLLGRVDGLNLERRQAVLSLFLGLAEAARP